MEVAGENLAANAPIRQLFLELAASDELSAPSASQTREVVRILRVKEVGDVNVSTLLSLAAIVGLGGVALLG